MKVILLVRVSTIQQSYDDQEKDLINYAIKLGYNKSDMIIIAEKESGIKLKEEERKGINEMKDYIERGNVERVIIWEISRLSRRQRDLFDIRDYLQLKRVQLTCLKPNFDLFKEDFSFGETAMIVFSLLSTISENEMKLKKERFKRAKERNAQTGRFSGGRGKRGYKVDEKGYYVIDDDKAKTIKLIFDLYVDEKLSIAKIKNELHERGIDLSFTTIRLILRDKSYCGVPYSHRKGNLERVFPEIIPLSRFEEARKIASSNRISPKITFNNNDYLASKILRCPICGHAMSPKAKNCLYYCVLHQYPYTSETQSCTNKCTVRADILDSLLWQTARSLYIDSLNAKNEKEIEDLKNKKDEYATKIANAQKELADYESRYEDNENAYIMRDISQSSYIANKKRLGKKRKEFEDNVREWKNNLAIIDQQLDVANPGSNFTLEQRLETVRLVHNITDKKEMRRIVRLYIKMAKVYYKSDIIKKEHDSNSNSKIREEKIYEIELYNGTKRYYLQPIFKHDLRRIYLAPETEAGYVDVEDLIDEHYQYVEMHQTTKKYLDQLKKKKDADNS